MSVTYESNMPVSLAATAAALQSGALPLMRYLEQTEELFRQHESEVQAFIPEEGRFERLRHQAESLLAQYPNPEERPPLFGLPIGVKDIFHVDGFVTRAGSKLPVELLQGNESESVTRLRHSGALILGKTVTTEFAYFGPGPTRNPHNLQHTPGGSSSGSAAAVARGMCLMAFGTQTIGSINRPAAFCGVVGVKPSQDRISKKGVLPLSPSLDHVGFFTPNVFDAELISGLLCYQWQVVVTTRMPVLGVPQGPYLERASAEGVAHFEETCQVLLEAGFEVKPVALMPDFDEIYARHNLIVAAEAAHVHEHWFGKYGHLYHPKTAELITRGQQVKAKALARALSGRAKLRNSLIQQMDQHGVDLWISPAARGAAPKTLESTGDPVMNLPWTHSGLPTVTLPSGFNSAGLPFGLQLTGRWYGDEVMLYWAADIEPVIRPNRPVAEG
jgi:Asp-tRNA(Asn)/Glu-tRNA(Gln) amidotransferase A subunit family amidase